MEKLLSEHSNQPNNCETAHNRTITLLGYGESKNLNQLEEHVQLRYLAIHAWLGIRFLFFILWQCIVCSSEVDRTILSREIIREAFLNKPFTAD
ncbi:hypothetical protein M513_14033, partial [Trichuris suis]